MIARAMLQKRTEAQFRARLEQANHDLAEAAAADRGWDRATLESAARRGYADQRGAEPAELLLVEVVADLDRLEVDLLDVAVGEHRVAQPVHQPAPVARADEHDREVADLLRLAQGGRLEQLVHRAEAAREDHEAARVADEHDLAREEVVEVQREVDVVVHPLLVRELDPEPDRGHAGL